MIIEGKVKLVNKISDHKEVFYNPRARLTRTIGVLFVYLEGYLKNRNINVCDPLAATGVRGIRYTVESGFVEKLFLNDKSKLAYKVIRKNLILNNIDHKSHVGCVDANIFLYNHPYEFDFIDIDPFGTPAPFIDSAVSVIKDGGVVAITSTDLAPLCGIYIKSALRKYGSLPIHTEYCHEIAIRILIKELLRAAGRHIKYGNLLSSHIFNQYGRVYMRISKGKIRYEEENIGYLIHNLTRGVFYVIKMRNLNEIKEYISKEDKYVIAGPMWIGPLHDVMYIKKMKEKIIKNEIIYDEKEFKKIINYLDLFISEAELPPYFYNLHKACKKLKRSVPTINKVLNALISCGYKASRTHLCNFGIKTNADYYSFLNILRDL